MRKAWSLLEARVIIEDWGIDHTMDRPHTSSDNPTPSELAAKSPPANQKPHSIWTTYWVGRGRRVTDQLPRSCQESRSPIHDRMT
jgi:hypothetical protein